MLIDSIAVMRIYVQDKTYLACWCPLTHWGRVTHICVGRLAIIGSDNGLSPEWRQAIMWTNTGILLFVPLGTNFGEILIEIQTFSLKKIRLKMSSAKCSFRLGLDVSLSVPVPYVYRPYCYNHCASRWPSTLPSAGTVSFEKSVMFSSNGLNYAWFRIHLHFTDDVIQDGRRYLAVLVVLT